MADLRRDDEQKPCTCALAQGGAMTGFDNCPRHRIEDDVADIRRDGDEPKQVLMHPALWPAFVDWLASRGLEVRRVGTLGEDDLPSWVIRPTGEALRRTEAS